MSDEHERKDKDTEAKIREAISMKSAFGDDAARRFLKMRGVNPDLTERILKAPPSRLRHQ
jgi:hypothetical protein